MRANRSGMGTVSTSLSSRTASGQSDVPLGGGRLRYTEHPGSSQPAPAHAARGPANATAIGDYVACRKNRDVQRGNAAAKVDRAQRNLSETMINTPYKP